MTAANPPPPWHIQPFSSLFQWQLTIDGSKWDARDACPCIGPISLIFLQFSTKIVLNNICFCPKSRSWLPSSVWEILDPPLLTFNSPNAWLSMTYSCWLFQALFLWWVIPHCRTTIWKRQDLLNLQLLGMSILWPVITLLEQTIGSVNNPLQTSGGGGMRVFIFYFCKNLLEYISPFRETTDTPFLDFWWHLPWVSTLGLIPCLYVLHLCAMDSSDSPLVRHLLNSWRTPR